MKVIITFVASVFVGAAAFLLIDFVLSCDNNYKYIYSFAPANDQIFRIINLDLCDDQELVLNFRQLERVLGNILLENAENVNNARLLRNCNSFDEGSEWHKYRSYVFEKYRIQEKSSEVQEGKGVRPEWH